MQVFSAKKIIIFVLVIGIFGAGVFMLVWLQKEEPASKSEVTQENFEPKRQVIGTSVQGREIESYTYGNGNTHLAFIGGIHGGYEWNSILLAYSFIDYVEKNPTAIPDNVTITIIPSANPDGAYKVIHKEGRFALTDIPENKSNSLGRFNANNVDLNRNFDCKWKPESTWRGTPVSAGSSPFSEPETAAIQRFVLERNPTAVIFWHSQANAVYASECESGILPETFSLMNVYAEAAEYTPVESFDQYEITGDAEGWLASIGIPAITVELQTHETIEWERNLGGIQALLEYYTPEKESN